MGSTFRLKRKLQEQGVDLSSRRATENFCLIGTPLPPLEKSRDTGEYVPLWKQDVRDEKGRRRLHGAFTGGFSAGYFNTVGSAEGWAPKSFVSSRSERAKQKAARPEDYMDEEDLVELRESQVMDKFGKQEGLGGTEAELRKRGAVEEEEEEDSLAKSLREALIPAGEDTPGMKLLRKMGWRPGQGVGPRVTWRQRKVQDLLAAGKSLNDIDIDALEDDEEAKKHMYPPRDTVATRHGRKEDKHGLGYVGQLGLQESLGQKRKGPSGPSLSAGFGLGALNEAEEDDIDVYDSSARGERTHMAFDASDPDAEDRFALKRSQARAAGAPRMMSAGLQRFDDGTPIATGFILADKPSFDMRRFPLPEVPAGWKPNPRRVWEKAEGKENVEVADKSKDVAAAWRNKLTPGERGAMLGETPLPSKPRSVFEYLSQKDRERIQHAATTFKAAPSEPGPAAEAEVDIHMLPFTPAHTAESALKGFMPFAGDPAKQARPRTGRRSRSCCRALALDFEEDDYSALVAQLAAPQPGKVRSVLVGLEDLRLSGLPASSAAIDTLYGQLGKVTSLHLNCHHLDEQFFKKLFPPTEGAAPFPLPSLVDLSSSGVDGDQIHALVEARKARPVKRVYVEVDDIVEPADEQWLRQNLEHFAFFEGSDDEEEDMVEIAEIDFADANGNGNIVEEGDNEEEQEEQGGALEGSNEGATQ
ncbi:hypothetical protein EWM64_g843 [Hericium alpestre]|uniref:G-patch domain-containing protein n=1 Tax=Hericium alpestre TaxID=135208 RepID=A0A4Z0A7Y3_9AGAM|nr:hypothetical protein EWM64_g843 [Hericium alpestre]